MERHGEGINNMLLCKYSKQFSRCDRRTAHRNSVSVAILGLSRSPAQQALLYCLPLEEKMGALLVLKQVKDVFQKKQMPL